MEWELRSSVEAISRHTNARPLGRQANLENLGNPGKEPGLAVEYSYGGVSRKFLWGLGSVSTIGIQAGGHGRKGRNGCGELVSSPLESDYDAVVRLPSRTKVPFKIDSNGDIHHSPGPRRKLPRAEPVFHRTTVRCSFWLLCRV